MRQTFTNQNPSLALQLGNKRQKCALLSQKYVRIISRFYFLLSFLRCNNKSKILYRKMLYLLPLKTTTWITFMPVFKHLHFQGRSLGSLTHQCTWTFIPKGKIEKNDWATFLDISGLLPALCVLCKITGRVCQDEAFFTRSHLAH